jgi:hypothetical protein
MKGTFVIAALLALGFGVDVYFFNGIYSHAASLMLAEIVRNFR